MTQQEIEDRKQRITLILKIVGMGVGGLLVAPIIMASIGGLIGAVVAAAIGYTVIAMTPVFALKVANWKMRAYINEIESNPIESLRNVYLERVQDYNRSEQACIDFETEIGNFKDEIRTTLRAYPEEVPRYQEIAQKMDLGLAEMKADQKDALQSLNETKATISKMEALYKMSLAAAKVASFNKADEAHAFQEITEKVAVKSVQSKLNEAFARLDASVSRREQLLTMKQTPMLTAGGKQ